jgi:ribosome-binding ATPase YchF (GTP1/OBG family)
MGLNESALDEVIRTGYQLLDLVTFLTAGEPEVRAWTVRKGTKAPEAAGRIHSDLERGFIRAEVTPFPDLVEAGSFANARSKGTLRLEGKDYVVQDGDVIYFRFSV